MSIYERLSKGETVDKDQLPFIDTSEKSYCQIFKPTGLLKEKETIRLNDKYEFF